MIKQKDKCPCGSNRKYKHCHGSRDFEKNLLKKILKGHFSRITNTSVNYDLYKD